MPTTFAGTAAPTEELAWWLTHGLDEACGIALSVSQTTELDRVMAEHDLVVTNVPDDELPHVISSAIRGRTDVVATNGVSRAAWDLQEVAEQAGIVLFLEASVAHGVRRLYGMQSRFVIDSSAGGRVRYVTCEPYTPSRRRRPHGQRPNFIRHDLIVDWPDQRPVSFFFFIPNPYPHPHFPIPHFHCSDLNQKLIPRSCGGFLANALHGHVVRAGGRARIPWPHGPARGR